MNTPAHHPQEMDYFNTIVEVGNSEGKKKEIKAGLLRVYPTPFNGYNAYLDIPQSESKDIKTVYFKKQDLKWEVIAGPQESPINGSFRGDYTTSNPPAWVFGLKLRS